VQRWQQGRAASEQVDEIDETFESHAASTSNPHSVTASQAGADPAGAASAVQSDLDSHKVASNPHGLSADDVGAVSGPAGSDGELQQNSGGSFAGVSNLTAFIGGTANEVAVAQNGTGVTLAGAGSDATFYVITAIRDNAGTIEYKRRQLTISGGIVTAGAESAWIST
jgi:hypothetical protein